MAPAPAVDRDVLSDWFARNRQRSRAWFELITPDAYYARPVRLRHPLAFYEGHVAAFNVNTLLKRGLGRPAIDANLEVLFERGIDPPEDTPDRAPVISEWPARCEVLRYNEAADAAVAAALATDEVLRADRPLLRRGLSVFTILEHEAMHHETLLYLFHRVAYDAKRRPPAAHPVVGGNPPRPAAVRIPAGDATLGADPDRIAFGWDNEFGAHRVHVPTFEIDVYDVTNRDFLDFVEAGGYAEPSHWTREDWRWRVHEGVDHPSFWRWRDGEWYWRGLFEEIPLPLAWPVYVSHAEASAYARWKGRRLPTEPEYHRAAFGTPEGREGEHPWGDDPPGALHGNFDLQHWDPVPVGSYPAGASAWGIHDLVGNGWEWTSTVFAPFPGFSPLPSYPAYSSDFFDGQHYVLKGASPATAGELVRRSWRNWFRPRYPYPYATFRCVTV